MHATVEAELARALHANATARNPDSILRTLGERLALQLHSPTISGSMSEHGLRDVDGGRFDRDGAGTLGIIVAGG